jgi:FHIPEP family protein
MSETREILGSFKVVVELAPSLKSFSDPSKNEGKLFSSQLVQYLNALISDLKLPAIVSLEVTVGGDEQNFLVSPFRILVNDRKCRLPMPLTVSKDVEALELARSVARATQQNLELIIDSSLSESIWERWSVETGAVGQAPLPVEAFHDFLSSLVCRGFSIEKAKPIFEAVREGAQSHWQPDVYFEKCPNGLDATGLKLFLNESEPKTLAATGDKGMREQLDSMQERLFEDLGIMLPAVSIETDKRLDHNNFRIQLNDIRLSPVAGLKENEFLVNAPPAALNVIDVASQPAIHPETGSECAIAESEDALAKCQRAGFVTLGPRGFITACVAGEIRRNAGNFLTSEILKYSLELLRETHKDLVEAALKRFGLIMLTRILRSLLDEEISIRNLRGVLESLLSINGTTAIDHSQYLVFHANPPDLCPVVGNKKLKDLDAADYLNCLRMALKRYISHKYSGGSNTLVCYTLDSNLERRIADTDGPPLDENDKARLITEVFNKIGNRAPNSNSVILTTILGRARLRKLIEKEFPRVAVLSFQELSPYVRVQRITQISLT